MRYVAAVLIIGLVCCVFALGGFKEPVRRESQPEVIALEIDHIADRLEETRNVDEGVGFLRVKAHALRQIK